jgi:hypothetical protein
MPHNVSAALTGLNAVEAASAYCSMRKQDIKSDDGFVPLALHRSARTNPRPVSQRHANTTMLIAL